VASFIVHLGRAPQSKPPPTHITMENLPTSPHCSNESLQSTQSIRRLTRSQAIEKVLAPGLKKTPRRIKMPTDVELVVPSVQNSAAASFTEILQQYEYVFGPGLIPPRVPLCRLLKLEIVRSLNVDGPGVQNLRDSFLQNGYVPDFPKFQVLIKDETGNFQTIIDNIRESWDAIWAEENQHFEDECDAQPEFAVLKDKMFFVGDGNHRLYSWYTVSKENPLEIRYHPRVVCKFLFANDSGMLHIISTLHALNA
jgi:hypothetical protein